MKDLLNRLALAKGKKKAELLTEALEYGEDGVNLLIEMLNDPELVVRAECYRILQSINSPKVFDAIYPGILLNPGDTIYCVYQSVSQYNDNWWYLIDSFAEILEDYDPECTKSISLFTDKESAEQAADEFHFQEISNGQNICPFEVNETGESWQYFRKDFNYIFEWCKTYNIPLQLPSESIKDFQARTKNKQLIANEKIVDLLDRYNNNLALWNSSEFRQKYPVERYPYKIPLDLEYFVEELLWLNKEYKLYAQLWLDAVGRFAFVQPLIVQEIMYLKLDENT